LIFRTILGLIEILKRFAWISQRTFGDGAPQAE
jgi:hypothetical protein